MGSIPKKEQGERSPSAMGRPPPLPVLSAQDAAAEQLRGEMRKAIAKHGTRGGVWLVNGFSDLEMCGLVRLSGTKIADRLEKSVPLLDAEQCADLFGCSCNVWLQKSRRGATPKAVTHGASYPEVP